MSPYHVVPDLQDSDPKSMKVRVCYHERDTSQSLGCSAEVTVYVDRTGLRLPELSDAAVREAEQYLRRILDAGD